MRFATKGCRRGIRQPFCCVVGKVSGAFDGLVVGDGGKHVMPAVDAGVSGVGAVVGRIEEQAGATHALEVGGCVVEEVVDIEDEFFAAEDDALDGDLRNVVGDPVDFVAEGVGELECGTGDVDAVLVAELAHDIK